MEDKYNKTLIRNTVVIVLLLMACLFCISFIVKRHSFVTINDVDDKHELRTSTVFEDIKLITNNDIFSHDALHKETEETAFINYMKSNVKEGDTIVHVSNSIGINLLLMAKLIGQAGRIYAYNPYEKYTSTIKKSAEANGFESRVKLETYAISDSSFDGILVYKNNFPVLSGEIQPATYTVPAGYSSMSVRVSSLDELLPNVQNINYLTIDNAGYEKILRGAEKLISRSKNVTIVLSASNITNWKFFNEFIDKFGFELFVVQNDGTLVSTNTELLQKEGNSHVVLRKK